MVGNLQLWAKIHLEAKHRHNCQEPGLLGTAGDRASQEHLVRKPRTGSFCVSRFCRLEKKVQGYYKNYVFHIPFPRRTSYPIALHALLRVIDQKSGIWDLPRKSRICGCHVVSEVMLLPRPMWRDTSYVLWPLVCRPLFSYLLIAWKHGQVRVAWFFLFVVTLHIVHIHLKRKMKTLPTPVYICKLGPKCFHHKFEKLFLGNK